MLTGQASIELPQSLGHDQIMWVLVAHLTKRSQRIFERNNWCPFFRGDDTGRRDLVIIWRFGRLGWNVVIIEIRLVLFVLGRSVSKLSQLTSQTCLTAHIRGVSCRYPEVLL